MEKNPDGLTDDTNKKKIVNTKPKSVFVILYCLKRNRLFDISLAVFYLQDDVALLLAALYDDYEFAGEEFHLCLGERF